MKGVLLGRRTHHRGLAPGRAAESHVAKCRVVTIPFAHLAKRMIVRLPRESRASGEHGAGTDACLPRGAKIEPPGIKRLVIRPCRRWQHGPGRGPAVPGLPGRPGGRKE